MSLVDGIDHLIPLSAIAPTRKPSTLHRWATRGVRGIRLETIKIGGQRFCKPDALLRFIQKLNSPEIIP